MSLSISCETAGPTPARADPSAGFDQRKRHDRIDAEHVGILEPQVCRAKAAHGKAVHAAAFARRDGPVGGIDVGNGTLRRSRFRAGTCHRAYPHTWCCRPSRDDDDDHGPDALRTNRLVNTDGDRGRRGGAFPRLPEADTARGSARPCPVRSPVAGKSCSSHRH